MASSESLRRAAKPGKELHALVDCVERAWRCHLLAIAGAGAGGAHEVRHSRVRIVLVVVRTWVSAREPFEWWWTSPPLLRLPQCSLQTVTRQIHPC